VRWYAKEPVEAIPIPVLGPDIFDPRQKEQIKQYTLEKLQAQVALEEEIQTADAASEVVG
jgi:NADH-quinone oxidoreductase subunit B